jgi:hypothetical protein
MPFPSPNGKKLQSVIRALYSSIHLGRTITCIAKYQKFGTMSAPSTKPLAFSRFQLPGLNLPVNWTPHEAFTKYSYVPNSGNNEMVETKHSGQGEGKNLFRTALNDADCVDGYVS